MDGVDCRVGLRELDFYEYCWGKGRFQSDGMASGPGGIERLWI